MRNNSMRVQWLKGVGLSMFLTTHAWANMSGPQTQNLTASPSSKDHVSVGSAAVLGQGVLSGVSLLHLATNELPYFETSDQGSRSKFDNVVGHLDAGLSYGLMSSFDLGIVFHSQWMQSGTSENQAHGSYASAGLTGASLTGKAQLMRTDLWALAVRLTPYVQMMNGSPYDGSPGLNAVTSEILFDMMLMPRLTVSANLGYRFSMAKDIDQNRDRVLAFGNALLLSSAVAYQINDRHRAIAEIYAATPQKSEFDRSDRHTTRSEMLIAHRQKMRDQVNLQYGLSSELQHSVSSADWRFFAGVSYDVGPQAKALPPSPLEVVTPSAMIETDFDRQPDEIITIEDVLFKFNSDQIADMNKADQQLQQLVKALRKDGGYQRLVIEGHTCSIGRDTYNLKLSQRRAMKIRAILSQRFGFKLATIKARGLGERVPIATNATEVGRKENRRVEFKIFRKSELVGQP